VGIITKIQMPKFISIMTRKRLQLQNVPVATFYPTYSSTKVVPLSKIDPQSTPKVIDYTPAGEEFKQDFDT
jgi:hypothetical protein